jgi:rSAM/selenodomain-associated transferase 2
MKIAIVVPMLNERPELPDLLEHLLMLKRQGADILLVDGGSRDGSAAFARALGFPVLDCVRGRARQMNAGAQATASDALLFLHADTRLPVQGLEQVQAALAAGAVWGRFDVRIEGRSPWLRLIALLMNLRSRWSGIATGDQAIFVTRAAFDTVVGFPEQPLMEDIELSKRLKRLAKPTCLPGPAVTSGRRWETRGVWRTIVLMWRLRWAYWLGASAETLAKRYR